MDSNKQKMINQCLNNIDFVRIQNIMKYLKWEWAMDGGGCNIPTLNQLISCAKQMLNDVYDLCKSKKELSHISSGGFSVCAFYDKELCDVKSLRIAFEIETFLTDL